MIWAMEQSQATPRERFRAQVRDEAKTVALRQLAEGGPEAVSVNAIGKALGVSGPALYRYFAGRDALLTELIVDAYDDLGAALEGAKSVHEVVVAYRAWALAQPHRYRLLFGPPLPGYDAHDKRLVEASQRSMNAVLAVVPGDAPPPPRALSRDLARWAKSRGLETDPPRALTAVAMWTRLHGFVSLEIGGNFASMGLDADGLFAAEFS